MRVWKPIVLSLNLKLEFQFWNSHEISSIFYLVFSQKSPFFVPAVCILPALNLPFQHFCDILSYFSIFRKNAILFSFCTVFNKIWREPIYFFIARFFRKEKKKSGKSKRLNSKTIRFDQKKWKDNLVLHYLISKWIFFLITFRRHQDLQILISPKSLILQTKKFLENDGRIQKWLKRLGFCRKV